MIKYINDGELKSLKSGFYNTLALKKINLLDHNKFLTKNLELDEAIKIYKEIAILKFPACYSKYSSTMLEYLYRNKLLSIDDISEIYRLFYKNCTEDDPDYDYGEYYDERATYVLEFMEKFSDCKKINCESFRDILIGDEDSIDLNVYGDLTNILREAVGTYKETVSYTEDEWDEDYVNIFQDDAFSHVIENYEMNDFQLILLNNTFEKCENGIQSEAYTKNGNTFITISGMQFLDGLNYDFIIMLRLIFASKI